MMRMADAGTGVLVMCAVVMTGLVLRREFASPPGEAPVARVIKEWREVQDGGTLIGSPSAPVRIVTFSDFQCPYCAQSEAILADLQKRHPDQVAVLFRHFPLERIHTAARSAALSAECAAEQGRFEAYQHNLFRAQDSIGTLDWTTLAKRAGVGDPDAFEHCVAERKHEPRVEADMALGRKIGVDRTPMYLLEDRLMPGTLTLPELEEWLARALRTSARRQSSR